MLNWMKNMNFGFKYLESGNNYTEALVDFYNLICILLILITCLMGYWMMFMLNNHKFKKNTLLNEYNLDYMSKGKKNFSFFMNTKLDDSSFDYLELSDMKDYPSLEGSWCLVPLGFVSMVSYPSMGLEYGMSPDVTPLVTLKIMAHQWYWVFELEAKTSPGLIEGGDNFFFNNSDMHKLFMETYGDADAFYNGLEKLDYQVLSKMSEVNLKNDEDPDFLSLLAMDNKMVLPMNTPMKLMMTSVDVLHSFAMPAWGVKMDAVPGRLSEQMILMDSPGMYWGQCSELCGPYHGFMPVVMEMSSYPVFLKNFFMN